MNRKYVYSALGGLLFLILVVLASLPAHTRSMFLSEFKHRYLALFVDEPPQPLEGLRRQNPEEYGPQPTVDADADGMENDNDNTDAVFAARDGDQDGLLRGDELSPRLVRALPQIDTDEDGAISTNELRAAMQRGVQIIELDAPEAD